MANLSGTAFEDKYNNASTGQYKDNTNRDITPARLRLLPTDVKDSFLNRTDDVLDEDNMTSDSNTKVPTQQSVKAYADNKVGNGINNGVTTIAPSQDAVFDALALKADLASPVFTGNPTAPTPSPGDNDTSIATTAFVTAAVAAVTGVSDGDKGDVVVSSSGTVWTVESASESAAGKIEIATQAETNTGTDDARAITALKLKNRDGAVATLSDGATVDITSDKNTLASSAGTRTFTISHTGDDITMVVTLSNTAAVYTFPVAALCVSEGIASGDNTCPLAGVSGDKYVFAIKKVGSAYYVVAKNFGQ